MAVARLYCSKMKYIVVMFAAISFERVNNEIKVIAILLRVFQVNVSILQLYLMKNETMLKKRNQFEFRPHGLSIEQRVTLQVVHDQSIQINLTERFYANPSDANFAPKLFRKFLTPFSSNIILNRRHIDQRINPEQKDEKRQQQTEQYFYKSFDNLYFLLKRKTQAL